MSAVAVRPATAGDAPAILRGFRRAFAAADPTFAGRDLEAWRWGFERSPAGWQAVIAVDGDGEVLAQYAGVRQRVRAGGGTIRASHAVDSFLVPASRGLSHRSLFVRAGELYAELFGGAGGDAFMWGLPVPRALRIGRARLGYEVVRTVDPLAAAAERLPPEGPLEVEELAALPAEVDALAGACVAERGLCVDRDRAWLDWRYLRRPGVRYACALARDGAGAAGLAVAREARFDGEDATVVCEWLVPRGRDDAAASLLSWCGRRARAAGHGRLAIVVPDTSVEWLALQRLGLRVRQGGYSQVARAYVRALDRDLLRREFFWTLGDTDLV